MPEAFSLGSGLGNPGWLPLRGQDWSAVAEARCALVATGPVLRVRQQRERDGAGGDRQDSRRDRAGERIEERHVGEERGKTFTVIVVLTGMFTSSCAVTLIWPTKKTTVEYTVDPLTVFGWNPGVAS